MSLLDEIRQALAELELVSHAPTKNWEATSRSAEHPGGKRPPGSDREFAAPDERQALLESYHGKTVGHFRAVWATQGSSEALRDEIRATVRAWRVLIVPEGQPPMPGDPQWKRWVAESPKGNAELARLFGVSREYIRQVRRDYAD